ncbi:MAG: hypothetical protein WA688_05680 [Thermoplasmata archaeon]
MTADGSFPKSIPGPGDKETMGRSRSARAPFGASRHARGMRYPIGFVMVALVLLAWTLGPTPTRPSGMETSSGSSPATSGSVCGSYGWQTAHLSVATSGCQAVFDVTYAQNFNSWNASTQYNFSFEIPWIAEFSPGGSLVRVANPLAPSSYTADVSRGPQEVNISLIQDVNVTTASGNWTPNDTWAGAGPQWDIGNTTLGTTTVNTVFHLLNVSANASSNTTENTSYEVKFDVDVTGWPWAAPTDLLGVGIGSLGAGGAHFNFNQSTRTLAESWNGNNRTFASLVFGGTANVSYPSAPVGHAVVSDQVGLFYAASANRESMTLLTFGGVAGSYSSVSYDPWVVFSPSLVLVIIPPPNAGPSAWFDAVIGLVTAVVAVSAIVSVFERQRRLRREGEELVEGMRRAISEGPNRPNRPS